MKKILFLALFFTYSILWAQPDEISVLFIGNSLTNGNSTNIDDPTTGPSIAHQFLEMATAAGFNVHVEMYAPNGVYIYDDPNNASNIGHCNRITTENLINSRVWDYVFVQDNVGSYMWSEGYISSDVGNANVQLYNKIKASNPDTREIFYAAQGFYDGLPSQYWNQGGLNLTYDNNIQATIRSYKNSCYLNDNGMHEIVTPSGLAWNRYCNDGHSKDDLYYDTAHPTEKGTYLCGAVVFCTIFKINPANISYTDGFPDAAYLRQIAYETVMDATTFTETNLDTYTPAVQVNGNNLSTQNNYNSYQWYEGLSAISGEIQNQTTIDHTSYYSIQTTTTDGCSLFSKSMEYTATPTNITDNIIIHEINIFPNPAQDYITIDNAAGYQLTIIDITGKTILTQMVTTDNKVFDITEFPIGIYQIFLKKANKQKTVKFLKF